MFNDLKVSFFLAVRSLQRSNRKSTVLTVFIIAMVFTNMILLPSIITGEVKNYENQVVRYYTSDVVVEPLGDTEENMFINNASEVVEKVDRVPGVLRATSRYTQAVVMKNKGKRLLTSITAIDPENEKFVTEVREKMVSGEYLRDDDLNEIIVGKYLAGHRDESDDFISSLGGIKTGDSIVVEFSNGVVRECRVKGIFSTGLNDVDSLAYISWNELEDVYSKKIDKASGIFVKSEKGFSNEDIKISLLSYGVKEKVKTWREFLGRAYSKVVESYDIINNMTVAVSLLIAVVVVFIVVMIKTINNRRQIGIMKAIGIKKGIIISNYVFQVIILSVLGSLVGVGIISGLIGYFSVYPIEFPDGNIVPYVRFGTLLDYIVFLITASSFAGYVPARNIANEDVLVAMRG
ncbi:putative ABC transport system permease protein [Methanomicrobium sp. W14]|uniref:ABC transporter permease n=1 Tax=Methanomicrobium sp. W14 TaxID=2817839 RepID=UPI001AE9520C|nr:FtsX-like permease family protein [Methanomicrobium sp. W14]MBP2133309.1 putative ABC transport system permease protein [Methanomicrobium sp. W14]